MILITDSFQLFADVGVPKSMAAGVVIFVVIAGVMLTLAFVVGGLFLIRKFRARDENGSEAQTRYEPAKSQPPESNRQPPQ